LAIITKNIIIAADVLQQDDLVAIPTETVYGLAANALHPEAVVKIFETKNRPHFDPLIVHVASLDSAKSLVKFFPEKAERLAKAFWPGPLTVVLEKNERIPDIVTSGLSTVGIRMPDHPLTLELLQNLDFPLAAPSANPFGYVSPTNAQHVEDQLGELIPVILDGGPCRVGLESTIVDCTADIPVVLRMGGITVEHIQEVIGRVDVKTSSTSSPKAPGMLISHYAPRKPIHVGLIPDLLNRFSDKKIGVISFDQHYEVAASLALSESRDLNEAARNFFSMMREMDKMDIDVVITEFLPEEGLGRAINDKIRRAAVKE
jgi:L-threonylcarbamoyladenylate synthase